MDLHLGAAGSKGTVKKLFFLSYSPFMFVSCSNVSFLDQQTAWLTLFLHIYIGLAEQIFECKIVIIFLPVICFETVFSSTHNIMLWFATKKNKFHVSTGTLIWRPANICGCHTYDVIVAFPGQIQLLQFVTALISDQNPAILYFIS